MSRTEARIAIVRKFTNYRTRNSKAPDDTQVLLEAMKVAASALFDLKSITKGRTLFKRKRYVEIIRRRDEIMLNDPLISQLGAFQKANKELWQEADQEHWEREASLEFNDDSIFE
jgi:hypothetical protein